VLCLDWKEAEEAMLLGLFFCGLEKTIWGAGVGRMAVFGFCGLLCRNVCAQDKEGTFEEAVGVSLDGVVVVESFFCCI